MWQRVKLTHTWLWYLVIESTDTLSPHSLSMFTRYLNTVGLNFTPTPGFLGHWRTLCSPTLSGWMCRPPWPNPRNYLSVNIRPPDFCLHVGWRQTPLSSCSRKSFQLSCAHMDQADKEPPLKRMRSTDGRSAGPMRQSGACRSPPPPMHSTVAVSPDCANRPSPECTWTETRKTVQTEGAADCSCLATIYLAFL